MFSAAQGLGVDNVLEIKVNLGTRMRGGITKI